MVWLFLVLSVAGLVASLVAHIASFFGVAFAPAWLLHIGRAMVIAGRNATKDPGSSPVRCHRWSRTVFRATGCSSARPPPACFWRRSIAHAKALRSYAAAFGRGQGQVELGWLTGLE